METIATLGQRVPLSCSFWEEEFRNCVDRHWNGIMAMELSDLLFDFCLNFCHRFFFIASGVQLQSSWDLVGLPTV